MMPASVLVTSCAPPRIASSMTLPSDVQVAVATAGEVVTLDVVYEGRGEATGVEPLGAGEGMLAGAT